MKLLSRTVLALLLASVACGDDNEGPLDPGNTDGTLTASVSGVTFNATAVVAAYANGSLVITAVQSGVGGSKSITLGVYDVTGVDTYDLTDPGNSATYIETTGSTSLSWLTAITQGSGSVTLTTATATRVVGTFTFLAPANDISGATGTKTVLSGQFDVTPSNPQ